MVVAVMTGIGFAVGFGAANGAARLLAAFGLVALSAYAISWMFVALGLRVSDSEAAQAAGVLVMFVLVCQAWLAVFTVISARTYARMNR